ncbi:unnamed protein product, partial [Prorocentrum cordatum]
MVGVHKLWTRCTQCQTCEWKAVLARRHNLCKSCGVEVKPFQRRKPRRVQFSDDQCNDSDAEGFYDAT